MRNENGQFIKGHVPWIKGRKGVHPRSEFKKGEIGEKNPNWKGGRYKTVAGYVVVKAYGHPKAYRNEVLEHVLVAERKLGRYLKSGEMVHHLNGIKDDNREENLVVCQSRGHHNNLHVLKRWARKYLKCVYCNTIIHKHMAKGLCTKCYRYKFNHKLSIDDMYKLRELKLI